MKHLAVIWDSTTGGSQALALAAETGARQTGQVAVQIIAARDAMPSDLLMADGYIFAFPENLAAISGVMKAFFDRSYYPCLGRIEGRAYAAIICAGSDGSNAARQVARIATGWRLRVVAEPIIVCTQAQTPEAILAPKTIAANDIARCEELGATIAAGLAIGMF